ncbi:MAG TPA: hypothetical protein VMW14_03290 [Candidatus Paceibacterota bacterium]|nr:hypothetical protein [Candidatus Paceibacterota bacterium]
MREEKTGGKRKKLVWTMVALALVVIIALAIVYVNVTNALNSALRSSLHTFALASVTYASAIDGAVDINVSLSLENPTAYALKVDAIELSFWVDGKYIGRLPAGVELDRDLPTGEKVYFQFIRQHITDEAVVDTLHKQTYKFILEGEISASASYLFVEAHWDRTIDFTREVSGIS